jgi:ubiquinone/menaquinone biosynthesis C-methylase UbiE
MPFGSIFSKFKEFSATTADDKIIKIKNNFITCVGFKIFGVPHIGLRLRARKIIKNSKKNIKSLLDAGCGTGVYSFYFTKKIKKIEAIDISKEKIGFLKKENIFKNIQFSVADLCKLPFKNNSFDQIICSDVLEHIKDDKKALLELRRVLKIGGILLLTIPFNSKKNKITYKKFNHERAGYDLDFFKRIARNNNLLIEKAEFYSYDLTNKISNFTYKYLNNKIILGIIFYPCYILSMIFDFLKIGKPNGFFVKLKKIN